MDIDQQEWKDLWAIVRKTERHSEVQAETLRGLGEKLDAQQCLSDKYFEAMDKRDEESARKFDAYLRLQRDRDEEQARRFDELVAAQERREEKFWKAIAVLIGAMVVLVLGKTAAEKIFEAYRNPSAAVAICSQLPYVDPRAIRLLTGAGDVV